MNETPKRDFLEALLAEESILRTPAFDANRVALLDRLDKARRLERSSRRITLGALVVALLVFGLLSAVNVHWIGDPTLWPAWLKNIAALCMLLFPFAALVLTGIYLFRYRRELHRSRSLVQQAAFAEVVRQVHELKQVQAPAQTQRPSVPVAATDVGPKNRDSRAFTLLELLVVIVIITVLAALFLPAFATAKQRARTTSCASNLGQLGKALALYAADFHAYPGTRGGPVHPWDPGISHHGPTNISWILWNERLQPYVQNSSAVFRCPAHTPSFHPAGFWTNFSYAYNAYGSGLHDPSLNLGLGRAAFPDNLETDSPMLEIKDSAVCAPADMVAIIDLTDRGSGVLMAAVVLGDPWAGPADRHLNGANAVFCDGHCEWKKTVQWNEKTVTARRRWNNDHQPHPASW